MSIRDVVQFLMLAFASHGVGASANPSNSLQHVLYNSVDSKPFMELVVQPSHHGTRIVGVNAPGAQVGLGLSFVDIVMAEDNRWMGSLRSDLFPESRSAVLVFASDVSTWEQFSCPSPARLAFGIEQPGTSVEAGAFDPRRPITIFAMCKSFAAPAGSQFNLISHLSIYPVAN